MPWQIKLSLQSKTTRLSWPYATNCTVAKKTGSAAQILLGQFLPPAFECRYLSFSFSLLMCYTPIRTSFYARVLCTKLFRSLGLYFWIHYSSVTVQEANKNCKPRGRGRGREEIEKERERERGDFWTHDGFKYNPWVVYANLSAKSTFYKNVACVVREFSSRCLALRTCFFIFLNSKFYKKKKLTYTHDWTLLKLDIFLQMLQSWSFILSIIRVFFLSYRHKWLGSFS